MTVQQCRSWTPPATASTPYEAVSYGVAQGRVCHAERGGASRALENETRRSRWSDSGVLLKSALRPPNLAGHT